MRTITSLVLFILTPNHPSNAQIVPLPKDQETETEAQDRLASMTIRDKVGQLFVFGFRGTDMDTALQKRFDRLRPGGVIIFGRNIKSATQISMLNRDLQKISQKHLDLPLFIMVDQEGGKVARIKINPSAPSALALGMSQNTKLTREVGELTGRLLSLLGFNMNLAPVLDLSNPFKKSFISNRSFGENPDKIKFMGEAFSTGLMSSGVIPTAKHFPGHGNIVSDSHKLLPVKYDTLEELERSSLIPFKWFGNFQYPSAIMVAHVAFPKIDPSGLPATFSRILLHDLLRTKLKYPGLIITDDVEMVGAGIGGNVGERAVRALEAGCDLVMVAWTAAQQEAAFEAVFQAVESGRLSVSQIDEKMRRILSFKIAVKSYLAKVRSSELPLSETLASVIFDIKKISEEIARENFNEGLRSSPQLIGSGVEIQKAIIFTADAKFFYKFRETWGRGASIKLMSPDQDPKISEILKNHPHALGIFYVTGIGSARILNNLDSPTKARLVVINTTHPGNISNGEDYQGVININAANFNVGTWLAESLKNPVANIETQREPSTKDLESRQNQLKSNSTPIN
ncbi:MAG: beta-N-acetylhexosaminidase [Bdellovibrionales bacterium]|nr:beta-N-acetylhexosaminidase [Bdellovibrionales bacterium]